MVRGAHSEAATRNGDYKNARALLLQEQRSTKQKQPLLIFPHRLLAPPRDNLAADKSSAPGSVQQT